MYSFLGPISPVQRNHKTTKQTLSTEIMSTDAETSIKPFKHVANMSMNTNISLEHVYDARIIVIEFEKGSKLRGCYN